MNKNQSKEIIKTVSLYLVLFVVSSMTTSQLLIPSAAANSYDCGTEKTSPPFPNANGYNGESYSKLGIKSKVLVKSISLCGTNKEDGSVVGVLVTALTPSGDYIETGYFKGNYSTLESVYAIHYFWGKYYSGNLQYSDISSGTGKSPYLDDYIYFETRGNIDTSNHDWHVKIERVSDYTINIDGLTIGASSQPKTGVYLEPHNTKSNASARFKEIQNAKDDSGVLTWVNWAAGGSNAGNSWDPPFHSDQVYDNEYCMYSKPSPGACPS